MKHLLLIPLTFVLLAQVTVAARTQELPNNPQPVKPGDSGWSRVRDLARGDEIHIETAGGMHQACRFGGATEDFLFCDSPFDTSGEGGYQLNRADVERVRSDDFRRNRCIIVVAAMGAGFLAAYAGHRSDPQDERVVDGLIGAGMGALLGSLPGQLVAHLIPNRVVYRQPRQERKTRASARPVTSQIKPNAPATDRKSVV